MMSVATICSCCSSLAASPRFRDRSRVRLEDIVHVIHHSRKNAQRFSNPRRDRPPLFPVGITTSTVRPTISPHRSARRPAPIIPFTLRLLIVSIDLPTWPLHVARLWHFFKGVVSVAHTIPMTWPSASAAQWHALRRSWLRPPPCRFHLLHAIGGLDRDAPVSNVIPFPTSRARASRRARQFIAHHDQRRRFIGPLGHAPEGAHLQFLDLVGAVNFALQPTSADIFLAARLESWASCDWKVHSPDRA